MSKKREQLPPFYGVYLLVKRKPTSMQDSSQTFPASQFSKTPAVTSAPQTGNAEAAEAGTEGKDSALDALLGRFRTLGLRAGFADRVIQSVQPQPHRGRGSVLAWATGLAVALAFTAGGLLWKTAPRQAEFQDSGLGDEASLVAALRSPELFGDDLALVANLGEVLEAEIIANHPLWREEK